MRKCALSRELARTSVGRVKHAGRRKDGVFHTPYEDDVRISPGRRWRAAWAASSAGRVSRPRRMVSSIRLRYLTLAQSSSSSVWQAAGSRIRNRIGPAVLGAERGRRRAGRRRSPSPRTACERDRDVEVVAVGVQGQVVRLGPRPGPLEDGLERHAVALPLGVEPRDVGDLADVGQRRQVVEPQVQRMLDRAVDLQEHGSSMGLTSRSSMRVSSSSSALGRLADVEFELPAAVVAGALAPELEGADLGDVGVEADGDGLARRRRPRRPRAVSSGASSWSSSGLQRSRIGADGVVAAGGRAEEAELGRLADDQAELGAGDVGLGPFLHPHRHDAEGLDRRRRRRARPARRSRCRRSTTAARRRGSARPCRGGPGRNRRRRGRRPGRGRPPRARGRAGRPSRRGPRATRAAELGRP